MKILIYLAGKDAEYHILRISINGFMKALEGLRVNDLEKGMIVTSSSAAVSLSTCGSLYVMVVVRCG